MPDTTFTDNDASTANRVNAAWLNMVNRLVNDIGSTASVGVGDALMGVKRTTTGAVATTAHDWIEGQTLDTLADFQITADGVTDRTAALVTLIGTTLAAFRGTLRIHYDTKFTVATVYAVVPTGMRLLDESGSCNWTDGSYKQKHKINHSGDTVSDDSQEIVSSSYHPGIGGYNTGKDTADQTDSAARRYWSLLHHFARSIYYNSFITGWLMQFGKAPSANKWRWSLRVQTPLVVGMADRQGKWITGKSYTSGDQVRNSAGLIYKATSTAVAGVTEPTGTGTGINDGGVTWNYVQAQATPEAWAANTVYGVDARVINDSGKIYKCVTRGTTAGSGGPTGTGTGIADGTAVWDYEQASLNIDATRLDVDEDGNLGLYGPAPRFTMQGTSNTSYWDTTGTTVKWRDDTRGRDNLAVSTTDGLQIKAPGAVAFTELSGATPTQVTPGCYISNGGATSMTNLVLQTGQTSGYAILFFANGNTTLVHNVAVMSLRGGVNVTPAAGQIIVLAKYATHSAVWFEVSRSF